MGLNHLTLGYCINLEIRVTFKQLFQHLQLFINMFNHQRIYVFVMTLITDKNPDLITKDSPSHFYIDE